ncbi:MAG: lysine--tRNA ligase [Actinomycetota bacterium]|nr:MAG: lysine--tRNA ligase [Actinomycetota bacterium]
MTDDPTAATPPAEPDEVDEDQPEQVRVRMDKRARLLAEGTSPYPVSVPVTTTIGAVRTAHPDLGPDVSTGERVGVAGRIIFVRNGGKLCFATLRSGDGEQLQAMVSLAGVGEQRLADWKAQIDIGDLVFVAGEVVTSRSGELSVLADRWAMAAKALRPLPVAHKPLNEETRVRQRYVDLIMRPEARAMARLRPAVVAALRDGLTGRGYLEVETPMLQTVHGGAAARPFVTHSNAFDLDLYLRIAPELFLKRCVVGGIERVFEINRNFRNEGADSTHSPEFAMLEFYAAYADYDAMAVTTRELVQAAAVAATGSTRVVHHDGTVHDLSGEWATVSMYPAVSAAVGQEISPQTDLATLRKLCAATGVDAAGEWLAGKHVEELFEKLVAPGFTGPTFVRDFPLDTSPLVREHRSLAGVVEKWDLYVDGFELATGYSELVDPVVQRERLVAQAALAAGGDAEAMALDDEFLRALEYGMPPSGGVGMGIDRLLMAITGLGIRETVLFPLVKPGGR